MSIVAAPSSAYRASKNFCFARSWAIFLPLLNKGITRLFFLSRDKGPQPGGAAVFARFPPLEFHHQSAATRRHAGVAKPSKSCRRGHRICHAGTNKVPSATFRHMPYPGNTLILLRESVECSKRG